jgi:hypothetical protein
MIPRPDSWYEDLSRVEELKKEDVYILLLDRFHGNIITVSENQMNELGWYKNG